MRSRLTTFWSDLKTTDSGCREWTGGKNDRGYGTIYFKGKVCRTHRVAWELANGPILNGLHVLHHCDNPLCCNPDHLFLGTNLDNIADKTAKGRAFNGRASLTHCPQAHPYSEANTYIPPSGGRHCRICMKARESDRRPGGSHPRVRRMALVSGVSL